MALLGSLVLPLCAAEPDLATARALLLTGRYDEAAEQYASLTSKDPAAAIGLARARLAVGRRDEARQTLEQAAAAFPQSAPIQAELALLVLRRGDHEAAEKHKAAALALDKDNAAARWVAAELLKGQGKLDEARQAYSWLVTYFNRAPRIDDPDALLFIGRGVAEHARWTRNSNQFRRLVGDVYPAALRLNKDFWPARFESALLYLEKYNDADAATEITAGLAINSQAAELHAARGALALATFDLATAKSSLDRALEINPELRWAHQLRADWLMSDIRPQEAIAALEEARRLNPRDEATLGRLLAGYLAVDPPGDLSERAQTLIGDVTKANPHCGEFYLAAGQACDRMRRFRQAADFYRQAGERMPELIGVRGQLGLVLMRLGDETTAAKLLAESFAIDPFNVRVKNQLEVLDVLQDYAVLETEHFVIKFDRGQDDLLARYAARHLEENVFPDLTKRLAFTPKDKTLIEIFSRRGNTAGHSWFSARMVGLPFIGTVGACAGKMVALSSPGELQSKYDWARVLGHEMVHVINLQQTDFHVPHWFTEGLAVHLEDQPRPRDWNQLLARRAQAGALLTLDDVTLGFVRPKSGDDWTLAYCQSELYIEHLIERFGDEAPGKMLAAYARHQSTSQALADLFQVTQAEFEASYRLALDKVVAEAGAAAAPQSKLTELQKRTADAPDDPVAAAQLARAWLDRDDKPQARRWALTAQELMEKQAGKDSSDPRQLAAYVLARLQLEIGDTQAARKLLEDSLDKDAPQEDLLALLAALKAKGNDLPGAQALYEVGDAKLPHSDRWLKGLVKIYLQTSNVEKLRPALVRLAEIEPDNSVVRKKLAELALAAKDFPAAADWAWQGIHADVEDAQAHALLAAALAGQDQQAKAVEEYEVALRLDASQADWHAGLARSLVKLGKKDEARKAIDRVRDLDAQHPELESLEKAIQP